MATRYRFRFCWGIGIVLGLSMMSQWCWAEKAYVKDSFTITFRTGPSTENKIISMLSSGQPLEILESRDKWTHVRLLKEDRRAEEGWVLNQYLMTRLPWEIRSKLLVEEMTQLKKGAADYLKLKATHEATLTTLESIEKDFEGLTEEYRKLKSSEINTWFLSGGGVLLCGLIIGLVLGSRQRKKQASLY